MVFVVIASVILAILASIFIIKKWLLKPGICESVERLDGRTVIITGSNCGIGKETASELYKRGAKVIMACRNESKAEEAAENIKKAQSGNNKNGTIKIMKLDLASSASIREFSRKIMEEEPFIDILINNAGLGFGNYSLTEDGHEITFGTNHLGHYLLTRLIISKLKNNPRPTRIINVTSEAYKWSNGELHLDDINFEKRKYSKIGAYGVSKLANIIFTKELARRLKDTKVTVYAPHPGMVKTEFSRHFESNIPSILAYSFSLFVNIFAKDSVEGAQTTLYCALEKSLVDESGQYYYDCKKRSLYKSSCDEKIASELWDVSEKLMDCQDVEF